MDEASEAVYALKPVTFRYNREYDATQTVAFGLIAEDVAEVNPELVTIKATRIGPLRADQRYVA